jgi:ABC-type branched-subunit amino acid transport system substrate-binding protein
MPQGAGLFDALGTEAGKRFHSVSVVYASDNNLFKNNLDLFKSGLPSTVTVKEFPVQSSSDVRTEVSKIIAAKTDAFTLFVPLETGIKVLKELAKYSTKPQLICDMDIELSIAGYTDAVGSTPFDGCISVAMSDTKTSAFVDQYKKAYSADPQFGSDYGYDVVQIIGQLAEKDKSSWPDYLNSSFNYSGASGSITFDQTGTRPSQGELHIFKDGKFVKIAE